MVKKIAQITILIRIKLSTRATLAALILLAIRTTLLLPHDTTAC